MIDTYKMTDAQYNLVGRTIANHATDLSFASTSVMIKLDDGKRITFRWSNKIEVDEYVEACKQTLIEGIEESNVSLVVSALLETAPGELTKRYFNI
jgi:predicted transcriptional regulator